MMNPITECVNYFRNKGHELRDQVAFQARAEKLPLWMWRTEQLTGEPCSSYECIAWDDPQIHLEWLLCDPANLFALTKPKKRDAFLATLTEEERKLYYTKDEDGASYSDLEHQSVRKEVTAAVLHRRKKK